MSRSRLLRNLLLCMLVALPAVGAGCVEGKRVAEQGRRETNVVYADEIASRQVSTLAELLVGRVPGVYLQGGELRIRGDRSITGSNAPLYVLDGMPLTSPPNIDLRVIESVEVIKGADAASYGVRGANGVIVITTKAR